MTDTLDTEDSHGYSLIDPLDEEFDLELNTADSMYSTCTECLHTNSEHSITCIRSD